MQRFLRGWPKILSRKGQHRNRTRLGNCSAEKQRLDTLSAQAKLLRDVGIDGTTKLEAIRGSDDLTTLASSYAIIQKEQQKYGSIVASGDLAKRFGGLKLDSSELDEFAYGNVSATGTPKVTELLKQFTSVNEGQRNGILSRFKSRLDETRTESNFWRKWRTTQCGPCRVAPRNGCRVATCGHY